MSKFLQQQEDLKHFGVLGMHWGHRKAQTNATYANQKSQTNANFGKKGISDNKVFKAMVFNKDTSVLTKKGRENAKADIHKAVDGAKALASKVSNSVAFKTLVFDKNDTTGLIFKKSEVDKLKNFFSTTHKSLAEGFTKWQIQSQAKDIQNLHKNLNKIKASKNPNPKAIKEHEDAIKTLEDDLANIFTPEELKKYRGE